MNMGNFRYCLLVFLQLLHLVRQEESCSKSSHIESHDKVWMQLSRQLQPMRIKAMALTFCEDYKPLVVQLWSPVNGNIYKLDWEKMVYSGNQLGRMQIVSLNEEEEFEITVSHKIAFKVDTGESFPTFHLFDSSSGHSAVYSEGSGIFTVSQNYPFITDLPSPVHFSIELCSSGDCNELGLDVVTGSPVVHERDYCQNRNLYKASGRVMLETARPLVSGTLRAFGAFYCGLSPVYIQLWEPQEGDHYKYQLVWQKRFIPPRRDGHYHIEALQESEFIHIKPEYKLAILTPDDTRETSIPTEFRPVGPNLAASKRHRVRVRGCQVEEFDDLSFPKKFRIDLCYDTQCANSGDVTEKPVDSPQPAGPCSPANIPGGKTDIGGDEDFRTGEDRPTNPNKGVGPGGLEIFYPTPTKAFKPDVVRSGEKDNNTPKDGENEIQPKPFKTGNETDISGTGNRYPQLVTIFFLGLLFIIL